MEKLKELKEKIENIDVTYDYDETYANLYNACIDYMNETQDFDFEYAFESIVDYDTAEELAKHEIENGGLVRLYYFLGDANFNNDLFKIDGYGNLTDLHKDDLESLKDELLYAIDDRIQQECEV